MKKSCSTCRKRWRCLESDREYACREYEKKARNPFDGGAEESRRAGLHRVTGGDKVKKRTMNVNIPVTDEQIERLEKLLPKVRDEIIKRYKDIFDEDTWDQLGPIYADVFEYIADKESNSFVVRILVNILISNEEKDQARARHEQKN